MNMIIEDLKQSRKKAIFDVTAKEFETAMDDAFKIVQKKVTIKGFRKGHVPRNVYEKNFGVESLYDETLNVIINKKASELASNKEITKDIISKFEPAIETKDFEPGKDFKVSLSFDVYPKVSLGAYTGLEIEKEKVSVSKEEVDAVISKLFPDKIEVVTKDGGTLEAQDIAIFDFEGFTDGKAFDGGKAENYELKVMSGNFIPGFEEQMLGMKSGDEKDINVKFPDEYHSEDLKGKDAVFKIKLHEIKIEKQLEITDEEVIKLELGANNITELKKVKEKELLDNKKKQAEEQAFDKLLRKIMTNAVVEIPQSMIDAEFDAEFNKQEKQAKAYGLELEMLLKFQGMDIEAFKSQLKDASKDRALFSLVLPKLTEELNIKVSDDEIEKFAKEKELKLNDQIKRNVANSLGFEKLKETLLKDNKVA